MVHNFLPCDQNQAYLLPPSLVDWFPQDHLAWFVLDAVEQIDLKPFYKKYRSDGVDNSTLSPSMMAGKHVLVEIPMALNLEDAQRVTQVAWQEYRRLMVAHTMRYLPGVQKV